jgi:hypothetical protein
MKKLLFIPLLIISACAFGQAGVSIPGVLSPRHSIPPLTYRFWSNNTAHLVLDKDSAALVYAPLTSPTFAGTVTLGNIRSSSGTPSISIGANAGTGATVSIVGNNQVGIITVNTGTSATTGVLCTLTLNGYSFPTSCVPVLTHYSGAAITGDVSVNSLSANAFSIYMNGGVVSSSSYTWTYHIGGY